MNLTIVFEWRYVRTPDGSTWTSSLFPYEHWTRYLTVFDTVQVVARVQEVGSAPESYERVDGDRVNILPVPYYVGPLGYVRQWRRVRAALAEMMDASEAVIVRAPSQVATTAMPFLTRRGHPYGIEVIGDPHDAFAPGATRHPLRPFFRWWYTRSQQHQARGAAAATYVTRDYLQRRYPARPDAITVARSDVDLGDDAFVAEPRPHGAVSAPFDLVTIGSFEQFYKRIDIVIDALGRCIAAGLDLRLRIIGDGRHRADLEGQAHRLGIQDRVAFVGQLPHGAAVREQLDRADLYVMASRQEGLPRAMVEAMARGLPCVSTNVGGIPELLPPECLVPADDAVALADRIQAVLRDPEWMARMSAANLERAHEYRDDVLRERQIAYLSAVRDRAAAWLQDVRRA